MNRLVQRAGVRAGRVRAAVVAATLLGASTASALPFNQDMVGRQLLDGHFTKPQPEGAVPRGFESRYIESKEAALKLENPVAPDKASIRNGDRLYNANCSPCHGRYIDGELVRGAVFQFVPGPPLTDPAIKAKSDGHFFQFIHFGGMAIMPSYGWKLSITEHWDIVNYLRHVQNATPKGATAGQGGAARANGATPATR